MSGSQWSLIGSQTLDYIQYGGDLVYEYVDLNYLRVSNLNYAAFKPSQNSNQASLKKRKK